MKQRYAPLPPSPLPVMRASLRVRAVTSGAPHLVFLRRRSARPYQELDDLRLLLVHRPLEGRPPFAAAKVYQSRSARCMRGRAGFAELVVGCGGARLSTASTMALPSTSTSERRSSHASVALKEFA